MFVWRDMVFATLLGLLLGLWLLVRSRRHPLTLRPLFDAVLDPVYFWFDLRGPDGRPSHSKVLYFALAIVFMVGVLVFGQHQFHHGESANPTLEQLSWTYLAYCALVGIFVASRFAFTAMMAKIGGQFGERIDTLLQRARTSGAHQPPRGET